MKNIICLLCIFLTTNLYSQTDSLIGPVKAVREKLIFLDSKIQNRKLFNTEDEYGHYGFSSRNHTLSRFNFGGMTLFGVTTRITSESIMSIKRSKAKFGTISKTNNLSNINSNMIV